jgi:hypothetical protein
MLAAGCPVDARGEYNMAPLQWASWHGNAEMVSEILRYQPQVELGCDHGITALGSALHGSMNGWHRDTWAMIAWTTNTGGSSIVRYGTNPNHLDHTAQAPYADNESTTYQVHRVQVKNLRPGTTYYFAVDSGQGEGTGTETKSPIAQFTTKAGSGR